MLTRVEASFNFRIPVPVRRQLNMLAAFVSLAILLSASLAAQTQQQPTEDYGPYNATFLPDGPGLDKPLSAPSPANGRATEFLERLGLNQQSGHPDPLLQGRAPWTLAFWFRSAQVQRGSALIAGIGDPSAEDARFIAIQDNHLALWLGRGPGASHLLPASSSLSAAPWHFAVAVSNGESITLYADGKSVLTAPIAQGAVAARIDMAPAPIQDVASHHFGGRIAALKIYRVALTPAQVETMAAAPPDFSLPTYEEASRHWPVQTRGMAGQTEPQDPSTLPRGKGAIQKPVAKSLSAADLRSTLVGANPWRIRGGWKLAPAPIVQATGEEISKTGFATKDWLAATVPGTVLTTMIDRGVYPNPDYGLNNLAIPESLAHQDYWYRVEFKAPPKSRGQRLTLTFLGVNYAAEVWLNDQRLGAFTGAFLRGTFDITTLVSSAGENALAVRVSPPPHPGIAHEQSLKAGPGENGGMEVLDGPTFAAAEGWDWIPRHSRPQHRHLAGRHPHRNRRSRNRRPAGRHHAAQARPQ